MALLSHWLVTVLLLVPPAGAALVAVFGRGGAARWIALSAMLLGFVLSLVSLIPLRWRQAAATPALYFRAPLIPAVHLEYEAGLDGLSFPLVVLTTALFPLLCVISWDSAARSARWVVMMLGWEFAALGSLLSLNFLLMLLFLVGVVIGATLLLRSGGAERKTATALFIFLTGSLVCELIVLVALARATGGLGLRALSQSANGLGGAWFAVAVLGFLVWMAIIPFHLWLAAVVSDASTPVAILLGVVVPGIGVYGIFRVGGALVPAAGGVCVPLAVFGVWSILYGSLCALTRRKIEQFAADAVTVAMGFAVLGFCVRTPAAGTGAMLMVWSAALMLGPLLYAAEREDSGWLSAVGWLAWLVAPTCLAQVVIVLETFRVARWAPAAYGLGVAASSGIVLGGAAAARIVYRQRFGGTPQLRHPI